MIFPRISIFTYSLNFFPKIYMIYSKLRELLKNKRDVTSPRPIAYTCLRRLLTYHLFTPVNRYI